VRRITIEGGVFELRGGLEVSAPSFVFFKKNAGRPEGLSFSLLVYASNKSNGTVWAEVEVQISETEEFPKKLEKIRAGKRHAFFWKLKEVNWNKEFPFTVSVFADENRSKLLVSTNASFFFEEKSARAALATYNERLWLANGTHPALGKDRLLIPGWKDEQPASAGGWSAEQLVEGTLADAALQADVKKTIDTLESPAQLGCEPTLVKQLRSSSNLGGERWSVKTCDATREYDVVLTPSPKGGTDIKVTRIAEEESVPDTADSAPAREHKPSERKGEPPFEWDDTFSSPGTSLAIKETGRMKMPRSTMILYEIHATGFADEEGLSVWRKKGVEYTEIPVTLSQEGVVRMSKSDQFAIGGFVPGQALDLALYSRTANKRAHAKAIPFPIQAQGTGRCWASAEIMSESGFVFLLRFQGFQPKQEVEIVSQYKKERKPQTVTATERGEVRFPVMFGPPDRGPATAIATSKDCSVSLQYNIGKDALRPQ